MILEIKKYPNPILKKKAGEIREISAEIKSLAKDMIETMAQGDGIGLAGPQVGESKRMIAIVTEQGPEVFINPKIVVKSGEKELIEEGCLSFPGLFLKISRAKSVEVEALALQGEKVRIKATGLLARIFQHEIDHLDGILIINRISLRQKVWRLING